MLSEHEQLIDKVVKVCSGQTQAKPGDCWELYELGCTRWQYDMTWHDLNNKIDTAPFHFYQSPTEWLVVINLVIGYFFLILSEINFSEYLRGKYIVEIISWELYVEVDQMTLL